MRKSHELNRVLASAAHLVACFGEHRVDDYFDCFSPNATFLLHTVPFLLDSRQAYRSEWERWEREMGFRVLSCESYNREVRIFGDVAILTHLVLTTVRKMSRKEKLRERETIVFARINERWLAIHEHLSINQTDIILRK